jgi:hypothetical protein
MCYSKVDETVVAEWLPGDWLRLFFNDGSTLGTHGRLGNTPSGVGMRVVSGEK